MNKRFIFFSKLSLLLVLFVILAGSVVRMTGSGMGCPDWPKCFGYIIPPTNIEKISWKSNKEYSEGVMILYNEKFYNSKEDFISKKSFNPSNWIEYTKHDYSEFNAANTWFEFKKNTKIIIFSALVVFSMGFQAWLGKLVVDSNLAPFKISTHMLMAMVIVCLLIYIIKKADA